MKPPSSKHEVLLLPVTGSDDSKLGGGGTVGDAVVGGVGGDVEGDVGGTGVRLSTKVVVVPGSVVVVVDDVLVDELVVGTSRVVANVVVGASVVEVVVDELVVGASVVVVVVEVVVDDEVVGTSVVVVVVEVVVVDELVVGASVVEVVVDELVVGASVVVVEVVLVELLEVVELSVPQPHVCERLNFGLPPLGVISDDDPDRCRSVRAEPAGTATKTLSCCPPFGMIAPPLTVYDGFAEPRLSVIETNANEPLFGAITKCQ